MCKVFCRCHRIFLYLFTSFYFIYVCSDSWVSRDLYVSIKTTTTTTLSFNAGVQTPYSITNIPLPCMPSISTTSSPNFLFKQVDYYLISMGNGPIYWQNVFSWITLLVKHCTSFNNGIGKHNMIADEIWQHKIVQNANAKSVPVNSHICVEIILIIIRILFKLKLEI